MAKKKVEEKVEQPEPEKTTTGRPDQESEEPKVEEVKIPKFINHGKDMKIRLGSFKDPKWITVKNGQIVELDESIAKANGLHKVE